MSTILVPVDLNEESSWKQVMPVVFDFVREHAGDLVLFTSVPHVQLNMPGVIFPEDINDKWRDAARTKLKELQKQILPKDLTATVDVGVGNPATEILRAAEAHEADLIIMASHKPSLRTYLLGANAAHVARHAHCSVYIVRVR